MAWIFSLKLPLDSTTYVVLSEAPNEKVMSTTTTSRNSLPVAPTIVEVAEYLGVNKGTVYRLLYTGKLKVIEGFARTRICPKSVEKFLGATGVYEPEPAKGRGRPPTTRRISMEQPRPGHLLDWLDPLFEAAALEDGKAAAVYHRLT